MCDVQGEGNDMYSDVCEVQDEGNDVNSGVCEVQGEGNVNSDMCVRYREMEML